MNKPLFNYSTNEYKFLLNREYRVVAFRYDIPRKIYKMTNSHDDLWRTWN
jgi:hypothetical protein